MDDRLLIKNLVIRLKSGDMTAFDEFYALTKKTVYYSIYIVFKDPMIIEDLMQDTYMEFLSNKDKWDEKKETRAYLNTIAKNKAINLYNKRKRETEADYIEDVLSDDIETYSTSDSLIRKIKSILNPKEFLVFIARVLGDYSFKEIAETKQMPIGTVLWIYHEARKKLKKQMKGEI